VDPSATDFRSSQALQRYSEQGRVIARPVFVIIGAPGSFEGRSVMCLANVGVLLMTFRRTPGHPHTKLGKAIYDAGALYGAGFAAVAAG
jgi:hypothetical protein